MAATAGVICLAGVVSGRDVSVVTEEMATGVIRGVTAGDKKGKVLTIPDACRKESAARITIMATTAITMSLNALSGPGGAVGDIKTSCGVALVTG
jgi:hypothetical protein